MTEKPTHEELEQRAIPEREVLVQRVAHLQTLTYLNQLISSSLEVDKVLCEIAKAAARLMNASIVTIWEADETAQTLEIQAFSAERMDRDFLIRKQTFGHGGVGWVAEHRQPLNIPDVFVDKRITNLDWWQAFGLKSFFGFPIFLDHSLVAVLGLGNQEPFHFKSEDQTLLENLAAQAAMAIKNARLFEEIRKQTVKLEQINTELRREAIDHKQAEEALRSLSSHQEALLSAIPDIIMEVDSNKVYTWANQPGMEFFGEDVIGKEADFYFEGEQETYNVVQPLFNGSENVIYIESWQRRRDGQKRLLAWWCRVLKDARGNVIGAISSARDITEQRQAEEERKRLEAQLQQAQKMESIGTLAGGIAHDFNNILSPIMIHSEMAMMDLLPDNPVQHNLKEIFKAGERAREMVKQILAFSRKGEGERAAIKITPILKEVLKLLRSSIPTTIDIHQKLEAESDTVFADPTQIHQILLNLCTNASHSMQERGGELTINLTEEHLDPEAAGKFSDLNPGPYLKLTVSDTGHGIDTETMNRIFEPYFTTKETGEGTGMGLAMAHGIVKSYDGDITVESEQGKGTTFNVYLPRIEADISPVEEPSVQLPKGTERILLVDDEKGAVDVIQSMLEKLEYKITGRTSSIEALEAFRNNPQGFDLVITDMTMPNMTGKDLAKELMSIRSDIPIILCTGFSEQIDERRAREMGISAFVMKPIVMLQIANTIREVLDKK